MMLSLTPSLLMFAFASFTTAVQLFAAEPTEFTLQQKGITAPCLAAL
jgi:hypothetical protein